MPGEDDIFDVFPDSDTIPSDYRDLPPEYPPSIITPWRSGKPNADMSITSSAGTHPGNCNFCHNKDDGELDGTPDVPSGFGPITVFTNQQNHHGTGVPTLTDADLAEVDPRLPEMLGQVCTWCHNITDPSEDQIRGCQNCHDRTSLHNIEADVDGDGTVPGAEDPYYGHIGNTDNCWGCHGNDGEVPEAQSIKMTTQLVPELDGINATGWEAGTQVPVRLAGSNFDNNYPANRAIVRVTDSEGNSTDLVPTTVATGYIDVTFPPTMGPDNWDVVVWKGAEHSAPIVVSITEPLNIQRTMCFSRYGLAILQGTGLSIYVDAIGFGTGVRNADTGDEARRIYRWSGGTIAAQFTGGCPSSMEVYNVNDSEIITDIIEL